MPVEGWAGGPGVSVEDCTWRLGWVARSVRRGLYVASASARPSLADSGWPHIESCAPTSNPLGGETRALELRASPHYPPARLRWNAAGPADQEWSSDLLGRVALGRVALTASFVHRLKAPPVGAFPSGASRVSALTLGLPP